MWSLLLSLILFCIQLFFTYIFASWNAVYELNFQSVFIEDVSNLVFYLDSSLQTTFGIERQIRLYFFKSFLGISLWSMSKVKMKAKQHFKPAKYQIFRFGKTFRKGFCGIIFACRGQHKKRKHVKRVHLVYGKRYILLKNWGKHR